MEQYILYDGKIVLEYNPKKHLYSVGGVPADGTTSILKIINKPALMYWAVNKAIEYLEWELPVGKPICELEKSKMLQEAKKAHRQILSDAGDFGTLVHSLIESHIKKEPYQYPVNPIVRESFEQFLKWDKENQPEYLFSERKIYSIEHNFAGTLDFLCKINGKVVIGDIKTSSGIWDEYYLQLAAYRMALMEEFPDLDITDALIIRCGKDGSIELKNDGELINFTENTKAFLAALVLHRRMKEMERSKKDAA